MTSPKEVGTIPAPSKYSAWALARHAAGGHKKWSPAWVTREPKNRYDVVIIGGGGHGLAAAYYLAKLHGITSVAVIERGWIGGGNTGRNTTVIRSNYLFPQSAAIYDFALKLYEGLGRELNYNIMLSQRGVILPLYNRHDLDSARRAVNAMHLNGVDAEYLDREQALAFEPLLNKEPTARFAIRGAILQRRGALPVTGRSPGAMRVVLQISVSISSRIVL